MGLPGPNAQGYKDGSPITFASGLQGKLLIIHGTGDDNVHYQQTEYLIDALVAANKPFTMMAYPNRTHSISEGEGTTLHLYSLLTCFASSQFLDKLTKLLFIVLTTLLIRVMINHTILIVVIQPSYTLQ